MVIYGTLNRSMISVLYTGYLGQKNKSEDKYGVVFPSHVLSDHLVVNEEKSKCVYLKIRNGCDFPLYFPQ